MNHHDTEHEDGLRRAMNIDRMFDEMREAFADDTQYYRIDEDDVYFEVVDDPDFEAQLIHALSYFAAGNSEMGGNLVQEVYDQAMHQLLERDYDRIMNAKKEEVYEPTN